MSHRVANIDACKKALQELVKAVRQDEDHRDAQSCSYYFMVAFQAVRSSYRDSVPRDVQNLVHLIFLIASAGVCGAIAGLAEDIGAPPDGRKTASAVGVGLLTAACTVMGGLPLLWLRPWGRG